jgi:hypothetical protein
MSNATSLQGLNSGWQVIDILFNASVGFADGEGRYGVLLPPSIMRPYRPHIASKIYLLKVRPTWERYGPRQDPPAGLGKAGEARAEMISFNRLDLIPVYYSIISHGYAGSSCRHVHATSETAARTRRSLSRFASDRKS